MTRRNVLLGSSLHQQGLDAVRRAHEQFDELRSLAIPEALAAAKSLDHVFTEALVIGFSDPQIAHDRLRSHFYVNRIITLDQLSHQARRKRFSVLISNIKLFKPLKLIPFRIAFKAISGHPEPRSLNTELRLLLETICPAHAPTAAIERSSLRAVNY